MTKKEYLIAILKAISIEVLPIAPDLLYLIENGQEDADMTNVLYAIFQKLAKESKDQKHQEHLQKTIIVLEKLKNMENNQKITDQKDVEDLEHSLGQI